MNQPTTPPDAAAKACSRDPVEPAIDRLRRCIAECATDGANEMGSVAELIGAAGEVMGLLSGYMVWQRQFVCQAKYFESREVGGNVITVGTQTLEELRDVMGR